MKTTKQTRKTPNNFDKSGRKVQRIVKHIIFDAKNPFECPSAPLNSTQYLIAVSNFESIGSNVSAVTNDFSSNQKPICEDEITSIFPLNPFGSNLGADFAVFGNASIPVV